MEVHRLGIKFFAADPASVRVSDFIQIFHEWIQKQSVAGHLLIDVHNYSHLHNGPGILLVGHEGNFSLDSEEGRPGLQYYRKTPATGSPEDRLAAILQSALQGCRLLEQHLRFKTDEFIIFSNDRLNAPNDERIFSELKPLAVAALDRVFPGAKFTLERISVDPKERLTIRGARKMGS
jgi:hypothetical protein